VKKTSIIVILFVLFLFLTAAIVETVYENLVYMPLVLKQGTTPTPTVTKTPKPPTPTPTVTPTIIVAEGGNSCVYALGAGRNSDGSTSIGGLVPSICSYLVPYQVQMDGQLLIVKAERIKYDTWGCQEGDFGYWPPIDFSCPPPPADELFDEYGRILWGDIDFITVDNSYKIVCGYCEECGEPYTTNCVNVYIP